MKEHDHFENIYLETWMQPDTYVFVEEKYVLDYLGWYLKDWSKY